MPKVQGLSKAEANYRKAENPKFSCHECMFMFPRLAVGGCRYVRGVIHAEDTCNELSHGAARGAHERSRARRSSERDDDRQQREDERDRRPDEGACGR